MLFAKTGSVWIFLPKEKKEKEKMAPFIFLVDCRPLILKMEMEDLIHLKYLKEKLIITIK